MQAAAGAIAGVSESVTRVSSEQVEGVQSATASMDSIGRDVSGISHSAQTLNESIVSMLLTFSMFAGVYMSYRSTKVAFDQKKANMMLMLGIALTIIGLAGSQYLIVLKRMAASSL